MNNIDKIKAELEQFGISSMENLEQFRLKFLAKKSELQELLSEIKNVAPEERKSFGQQVNELKQKAQQLYEDAKAKMEKAGYVATVSTRSSVGENGEVATIICTKTGDGNIFSQIGSALENALTGTMYDSVKSAKAAYDKTKDAEGKTSATLAGKWVLYGNEEAIKIFK